MEDDPANIAWTIFARVMDIRFNCPRCGQSLSVEEKGAGMVVNCPTCKGQIEIPRSTAPAPAPKLSVPTIPVKPGIKTATVLIIGGIILFAFLTQHKNSTQDIGQVVKTSMQENSLRTQNSKNGTLRLCQWMS